MKPFLLTLIILNSYNSYSNENGLVVLNKWYEKTLNFEIDPVKLSYDCRKDLYDQAQFEAILRYNLDELLKVEDKSYLHALHRSADVKENLISSCAIDLAMKRYPSYYNDTKIMKPSSRRVKRYKEKVKETANNFYNKTYNEFDPTLYKLHLNTPLEQILEDISNFFDF